MLATYIVGLFPLPCHTSLCFCNICVINTWRSWPLTPATPPTCNCFHPSGSFSFSRPRIPEVAYHFDVTDGSAICSFLSVSSVLHQASEGIPASRSSRSWEHPPTYKAFLKASCDLVDCLLWQLFGHLTHDGVFSPVELAFCHVGPCL